MVRLVWMSFILGMSSTAWSQDVVGGRLAAKGAWDDAAAIYYGYSVGCTGTLIAPDVVLTAGHCIGGIDGVEVRTTDYSTYDGEYIEVIREIEYPNSWYTVDVGVLILAEKSTIPPRVIANDCVIKESLRDGANVAIVGFGATDIWGSVGTTRLHEGFTTINDHDCSDLWTGCNESSSPGGELSAGGAGIDACFGDSGGPLYLRTERGDFLIGATSRSYAGTYAPCEEGGIYGRPDYVFDWIESVTGRKLPRPDCGQEEEEPDEPDENEYNFPPKPEVDLLIVHAGESGHTVIKPNDPDTNDTHSFAVLEPPETGQLDITDDGTVSFQASKKTGFFSAVVLVSDSGTPTLEREVVVEIEVLAKRAGGSDGEPVNMGGCACTTGAAPLSILWLGWLPIWAARRRRESVPKLFQQP